MLSTCHPAGFCWMWLGRCRSTTPPSWLPSCCRASAAWLPPCCSALQPGSQPCSSMLMLAALVGMPQHHCRHPLSWLALRKEQAAWAAMTAHLGAASCLCLSSQVSAVRQCCVHLLLTWWESWQLHRVAFVDRTSANGFLTFTPLLLCCRRSLGRHGGPQADQGGTAAACADTEGASSSCSSCSRPSVTTASAAAAAAGQQP